MSKLQYNLQFEKLCNSLELGKIVGVPKAISGGLLHKMYSINTSKGKYAIKALNPNIMQRPMVIQNYINSERIANRASNHIPAFPAKQINGTYIQEIENQYYLVFDWVDGISLGHDEINEAHCERIGAILADIHMTDFSEVGIKHVRSDNAQLIDWNYYLQEGKENSLGWVNLLLEIIDKLYDWNFQANKSANLLDSDVVISHRDLDPKNVIWIKDNPIIIDWEAAGHINSMHELIETATYWSENKNGTINKEKFLAFIGGYKKRFGLLQTNWKVVLINGFRGKLDWLEYSLKRSLWIDCVDEEEQKLGTTQVTETINAIRRYANMISKLEKWLNKEIYLPNYQVKES